MASKLMAVALLLLSGFPYSASAGWNENMALAIDKGSHQEIRRLLIERKTGNPLEVDFGNAMIAWKALGTGKDVHGILVRNFQSPLMDACGASSLTSYSSLLANPKVPELAKDLLLQAVIEKSRIADSGQFQSLRKTIKAFAANASNPVSLRAAAIKGLAFRSDGANEDSTYLAYLRAGDSSLKSAAYWSLGHRIRANNQRNRTAENTRIFSALKGIAGTDSSTFPIRALSQLGMDSARDYLADKCSGSAEKLLVVLKHDPYMRHTGLLAEALKMERDPVHGEEIRSEIRSRVRQPDAVVAALLGADNTRIEAGLNLLADFPDLIPKYSSAIEVLKTSPVTSVKDAALALESTLPNTSEAAE